MLKSPEKLFDQEREYRPPFEDNGDIMRFLGGILEKGSTFVRHFDTQVNIIIGISSAVFTLSFSNFVRNFSAPLFVIALFSGAAALVGLYAVHPPRYMRKRQQTESFMYNKKIAALPSSFEYKKILIDILKDRDKLVEQYAMEIYNTYKYYYQPKRKLFHIARELLIAGILLGFLTFAFGFK